MKLFRLAVAISVVGLGFACSPGSESIAPDPDLDTLRAALRERDELERKYLLTSYLRTLGPEDLELTSAEFEKHRAGIEQDEVRLWMLAWARFDGPGAFATARDWPTDWKSTLMGEAMYAWGFHDGRAAVAESEKVEGDKLRQAAVAGWMAGHDRVGVTEYAANVVESKRRFRLALRLAGHAKRDGAEAVMAWADAVPEDAPNDFKATVFGHAAGAVASLDPDKATAWYEARMEHAYTEYSLRSIANKWSVHHDPAALIAWIVSLPQDESRLGEKSEASRTAFRAWAGKSSGEVAAWIEAAPAGPIRDMAIEEYTRVIADESPDEAVHLVASIDDEELRRRRTLRYSRKWFAKDPDAAQAWLEEADVPPEWQQQILNNLPHAKRAGAKQAGSDG
jgi:hypothetical protein